MDVIAVLGFWFACSWTRPATLRLYTVVVESSFGYLKRSPFCRNHPPGYLLLPEFSLPV